ncbi:MAG: HEAT repeat domain-containing protein, partial [Pirellulales bacterium]
ERVIAQSLEPGHYRNLNNAQATGAEHMMIDGIGRFRESVALLSRRDPAAMGRLIDGLLDSPYPFAHYLALRAVGGGAGSDAIALLLEKLDSFAATADTVGLYWTCEALVARLDSADPGAGRERAIAALARYTEAETPSGIYGPPGMGYGYIASKSVARLSGPSHPAVGRLLSSDNLWLRAGAVAGLVESHRSAVGPLLRRLRREDPAALVRAEAEIGLRRLDSAPPTTARR